MKTKIEAASGLSFPFLFGGTFIEGIDGVIEGVHFSPISLPFRRDFH